MSQPSPLRWLLFVLLLLPIGVGSIGCRRSQAASPSASSQAAVPIAPIVHPKRAALSNKLQVAGELIPYQNVELHAKVAGYIKHIYVDIGDRVHKGEDLADLEIPELVAQVHEAQAGVQRAQEDVLRAKSAVQSAEASHIALHAEYTRLKEAAQQPGLIAQQELDDAQAKDASSQAEVDASKANLSAKEEALEVAKANSLHYTALASYSHIIAPFNGVVTWRYSDTGALVQAGTSSAAAQPVVTLAQTSVLRLRLPVPSNLAPFVHIGDPAKIRIEATGEKIVGKVVRTTGSLDTATRTMQVEIDLNNDNNKILPGMYADVTLNIRRSGTGLTLPVQAVDQNSNPPYALVVDDHGQIEKHTLQLGIQTPTRVEVLSGVTEGDDVVATNLASYTQGEAVRTEQVVLPAVPSSGGNGDE